MTFGRSSKAPYNPRMRTRFALLLSLLVLTACGSGSKQTNNADVHSAKNGVAAASALASENLLTTTPARPSSILGIYAAMFLSTSDVAQAHSALDGVAAQIKLYFSQEADESALASTLEQLGTTLEVNIPDMLNRSTDRPTALDQYVTFLQGAMTEAKNTYDNYTSQYQDLNKQISAQRSVVSSLSRDENDAVRNKDFALAGAKQELLTAAEAKLTELNGTAVQVKDGSDLLNNLMQIGTQRLQAIQQNREVLLSGLAVVNVPGINDLGILKQGQTR